MCDDHGDRLVPGQAAVVAPRHEDAVVRLEARARTAVAEKSGLVSGGCGPRNVAAMKLDEDVTLAVEPHDRVGRPLVEPRRQRHAVCCQVAPVSCETATPIPA